MVIHRSSRLTRSPRSSCHIANRRGIIVYLVLFVILILTILTVQFHRMAVQGQASTFRFEKNEVAHQLAEMAMEEAFENIRREGAVAGSPLNQWLIQAQPSQNRSIPTPMAAAQAKEIVKGSIRPEIRADAKILPDIRRADGSGNPYYGREAVGTLQITITASLEPASGYGKAFSTAVLHRLHDYKVVCMRSARNNASQRDRYAQNFILDYALLVQNGFDEFETSKGFNLNHQQKRITVNQDQITATNRKGKIYIGGTGKSLNKYVYLNISDRLNGPDTSGRFVPAPTTKQYTVDYQDAFLLFPEIKRRFESAGIDMGQLKTIKGYFDLWHAPICRANRSSQAHKDEETILRILYSRNEYNGCSDQEGMDLLSPAPLLAARVDSHSILQGDIRMRFVKCVKFHMEETGGLIPAADNQKLIKETTLMCADSGKPASDNTVREFIAGLKQLVAKTNYPLWSELNDEYAFKGGQTGTPNAGFAEPRFFRRDNTSITVSPGTRLSLRPYHHVNLWCRRMEKTQNLIETGIVDQTNNRINAGGIDWVYRGIALGDPNQPYTIVGQGVFVTPGDIEINGDLIKQSDKDFLVLHTYGGNIFVNGRNIQASLIALGENKGVIARQPFTLKGALAVDKMNFGGMVDGTYELQYDPILKSDKVTEDLYVVVVSPAISLQRETEESS